MGQGDSSGQSPREVCVETKPTHGTQIEYFRSDGNAFLWYPGNRQPVKSVWKLGQGALGVVICFMYPRRSYNPVTRERGGSWRCAPIGLWAKEITEVRTGDLFALSSGTVPWRLERGPTTFSDLLARKAGSEKAN